MATFDDRWPFYNAPPELLRLLSRPGTSWRLEDVRLVVEWLRWSGTYQHLVNLLEAHWAENGTSGPATGFVEIFFRELLPGHIARYRPSDTLPHEEQFAEFIQSTIIAAADDSENWVLGFQNVSRLSRRNLGDNVDNIRNSERVVATPSEHEVREGLRVEGRRIAIDDLLSSCDIAGERSAGGVGDWVECTVFGPSSLAPGSRALIQAFAHTSDKANEAAAMAKEFDERSKRLGTKGLGVQVPAGTRLTFTLTAPDLRIQESRQTLVWRGKTANVSFAVAARKEAPLGTTTGTVTVSVGRIPVGQLNIVMGIERQPQDNAGSLTASAKRYEQAFVSYASRDRDEVIRGVRMLGIQGIKYFQDVLHLEPGQRWAKELYRHIDECDLFLLFWSKAARRSKWVLRETRYAFDRKGGDSAAPPDIHPIIVQHPAPPPPRFLRDVHFNDKLVYFIGRRKASRPKRVRRRAS